MTRDFGDPRVPRAVVFSHPNHEITLFGFLRRTRPAVVYLTDGGGAKRVEETRTALQRVGCLDRATFLHRSEASFYGALLDRDVTFWRRVADDLRAALSPHRPSEVLCDAVEFYNPVHDVTLPLTLAATAGLRPRPDVFEVPLVWQRSAPRDDFVLQRAPPSRQDDALRFRLTAGEAIAKRDARDRVYTCLREQMGSLFCDAPLEHLAVEEVMRRRDGLPEPGDGVRLRYEERGRLLAARGEHPRAITYAEHWRPVAESLANA